MGLFSNNTPIEYDADASKILKKDHWRVSRSFRYWIDEYSCADVPSGYLTDGATVPQVFWNIIPPWGAYGLAAITHDVVCEYLTIKTTDSEGNLQHTKVTRATCDKILKLAMQDLHVSKPKIAMIYYAVCLYRIASRTDMPQLNLIKLGLEEKWRAEHPECSRLQPGDASL